MAYNPVILIGHITKVLGYEGEVSVKLDKNLIGDFSEIESVFLETEGKPVPFFIEYLDHAGGDTLKVKFKDYNNTSRVSEFVGCRIFSTAPLPRNKNQKEFPEIAGFTVIDQDNNTVGTVKELTDTSINPLIVVCTQGSTNEILIPFQDDLIISLDLKKKIIRMTIPEGLADINL